MNWICKQTLFELTTFLDQPLLTSLLVSLTISFNNNKTVLQAHKHLCRLIHLKTGDQHLKTADLSIYVYYILEIPFYVISSNPSQIANIFCPT